MKSVKIGLTFTFFCLLKVNYTSAQNPNITDASDLKQAKRDLSFSYSAADIGSKEGTHIKTITVIKNIAGKKDKSIKVDSKLHKVENWGSHFRENFDSFGKIPEIPNIDDLINDKSNKKQLHKSTGNSEKSIIENISEASSTAEVKTELNVGTFTTSKTDQKEVVEKIPGDVELINAETANLQLKSQSLPQFSTHSHSTKPLKRKIKDRTLPEGAQYLTQYSTPQHSVRQYFIQADQKLKGNLKKSSKIVVQPCDRAYPLDPLHQQGYPFLTGITINNGDNAGNVVKVTTPSGRTYDIPLPNTTSKPPYIAPGLKKTNNYNSSSDNNNNSNNVNNNINIGRPSFNFNNFLGTQPVNIPVNQPVEIPITNPDPTTEAPPAPNATNFFPLNIPFGFQPNGQPGFIQPNILPTNIAGGFQSNNQPANIPGGLQPNFQPANLIPGIPGLNPYNNQAFNPSLSKGYNPHGNIPNYGYLNNNQPQPVNIPYNQPGIQGFVNQNGIQGGLNQNGIQGGLNQNGIQGGVNQNGIQGGVNQNGIQGGVNQNGIQGGVNQNGIQGVNGIQPNFPFNNQFQPVNQDTSAVTFPNLSDSILNNNNLILQQNLNNKQFIPPQNVSGPGSFSINNNNNYNNPNPNQPYNNRFVPTANKINYAIPYTNLPKRLNNNNNSNNNNNYVAKQKGRSRGLRY